MRRGVEILSKGMAYLGGVVLIALILMTCVSVLGREINGLGHSAWLERALRPLADVITGSGIGPITGDYELVEAGIAFTVFAFLPLTQFHGAHATVNVFTSQLPQRGQILLEAFWEVVLMLAIWLITWRLYHALTDKMAYGETTFLLQMPLWWPYLASFVAASIASVVALYCAGARIVTLWTGQAHLPQAEGEEV